MDVGLAGLVPFVSARIWQCWFSEAVGVACALRFSGDADQRSARARVFMSVRALDLQQLLCLYTRHQNNLVGDIDRWLLGSKLLGVLVRQLRLDFLETWLPWCIEESLLGLDMGS